MPTIEKIIEEKQFLSDRISTQVRLICCAILGVIWGFFISDVEIIKLIVKCYDKFFIFLIFLSIVILAIDYLQYLSGYFNASRLLDKLLNKNLKEGDYDKDSLGYKMRAICFYLKQILLFGEIALFVSILTLFFNNCFSAP